MGLAHIMRDSDSILATSIGITHVRLLSLLKTMVVLQRDPETLANHQQEREQTYRYRTSLRRSTPSWNKAKRIEVQVGSVGSTGDNTPPVPGLDRRYEEEVHPTIMDSETGPGVGNEAGRHAPYVLHPPREAALPSVRRSWHPMVWSSPRMCPRPGGWRSASQLSGRCVPCCPKGLRRTPEYFHPAYLNRDEERPVRWSTVAEWTGRTVHPLMQFERIAGLSEDPHDMYKDPPWGSLPKHRSIPERECRTLIEVLRSLHFNPRQLLLLPMGRLWKHRHSPLQG